MELVLLLFFVIGLLYGLKQVFTDSVVEIQRDCKCGRYDVCKSTLEYRSTSNGVSMSRKNLGECGEFHNEIEKFNKVIK